MAAWGAIAGYAGQAGGTAGKMAGYYMNIKQSKSMERYNLGVATQNAQNIRVYNDAERMRTLEEHRRVQATTKAAYNKSGAVASSGTPMIALKESARNMEVDQLNQLRKQRYQEATAEHQKELISINARNYRVQQRIAGISTLLGSSAQGAQSVYKGTSR